MSKSYKEFLNEELKMAMKFVKKIISPNNKICKADTMVRYKYCPAEN